MHNYTNTQWQMAHAHKCPNAAICIIFQVHKYQQAQTPLATSLLLPPLPLPQTYASELDVDVVVSMVCGVGDLVSDLDLDSDLELEFDDRASCWSCSPNLALASRSSIRRFEMRLDSAAMVSSFFSEGDSCWCRGGPLLLVSGLLCSLLSISLSLCDVM